MSNVSNRHSVVPFISGESKALSGQRLAKVGYKSSKQNPAKFPSVCASIPRIPDEMIEENVSRLKDHFRGFLETAQDGIFKSLYESRNGSMDAITDEDISIDAIIGFLEAESTGGRLTKETVYQWFDQSASEATIAVICEKLGFPESLNEDQMEVVSKHRNAYREVFASLSAGKTMLNQKQINGLETVLGLIDPESDVQVKITKRIAVIKEEINKVNELADLLG